MKTKTVSKHVVKKKLQKCENPIKRTILEIKYWSYSDAIHPDIFIK